jgi:hypothetical protein
MFGWLLGKRPEAKNRTLIGNLDALERKTFFIRWQGQEWPVPEMTVRDYAAFVALLQEIEDKTKAGDIDGVTEAYEEMIRLCVPSLAGRRIRKMSLVDQTAFVAAIMQHHGVDPLQSGKKKQAELKK